jgi:hypothetical protein
MKAELGQGGGDAPALEQGAGGSGEQKEGGQ